jgi:hypothetical protein
MATVRASSYFKHVAVRQIETRAAMCGCRVSYSRMTGRWRIFDASGEPVMTVGRPGFSLEEAILYFSASDAV